MKIDVLTLFPDMFESPLNESILKKAQESGLLSVSVHNIRDYAEGRHQVTDFAPYGGGAGLVMKPEPIVAAIEDIQDGHHRILLTPRGKPLTHKRVCELAKKGSLLLLCGRYEGVDERVTQLVIDEEISIGDFVVTGGELPAMMLIDAVTRHVPGVLGNEESIAEESFSQPMLEYPQYTRPAEFRGLTVPDVLCSGDHEAVAEWRRLQALEKTKQVRPELIGAYPVYTGLVHYPVYDKNHTVVATSITPIDLHDISRSSRTYGIQGVYIISPTPLQNRIAQEMLDFWQEGFGAEYNKTRADALAIMHITEDIDSAIRHIEETTGKRPQLWVTSAKFSNDSVEYGEARQLLADNPDQPILLLFGTGWGLIEEVIERADVRLGAITCPLSDYNHLSVRSAAAIILDRLLGNGRYI